MYICARGEKFDFAREIGVGLIESSIELTTLILRESPKELIFIGSAGSYDKNIKILDIFVSCSATQIESSFANATSYTPLDNKIEIVSHETTSDNFKKLIALQNKATINSSNYINIDESYSNKMLNAGILLENMEFFSILKVADYFKIPSVGIFCVTNYCNANAHSDFIKNQALAKERLINFIRELKQES